MAGTASLRSDPPREADSPADERRAALARYLAEASGASAVEVIGLAPLRGGAIQENWALDAHFSGGLLAGDQRLVLRTAAPTGVASSLDRLQEFAVLKAAFAAQVTVPEPLFATDNTAVFGKAFFIMRRVDGIAAAHRITRDPVLEPALPAIAERLGRELARIHTIRPPRPDLAFLRAYEEGGPAQQIAGFRAYLQDHPTPRPVLEWGIRWLETHIPPPIEPVLCHHDFRTGNYMLDGTTLSGVLDWEFAGWGDPHEDIGWFCCKGWRFARLDREAGGIAGRTPLYRGYETESGRSIDPERVFFWEVLASVRWAVIALQQSDRYMIGGERNLDLALTGRRATECELEVLMLLDPGRGPSSRPPDGPGVGPRGHASPKAAERHQMRDLPTGKSLLALARDVLLNDLMQHLPAENRLDALLVANSMAIAEREAVAGEFSAQQIFRELEVFYASDMRRPTGAYTRAPRRPIAGEGAEGSVGGEGDQELARRFAHDLRGGAFESSYARERDARDILWRLTIAKLRQANPRFLAANGFS
jgi:aminoglycoside phosphotransferase (APT) family kinase protein